MTNGEFWQAIYIAAVKSGNSDNNSRWLADSAYKERFKSGAFL